ncbi:hypothetical protein GCM10007424_23840 [Flavobacterium suaedae]|uniref:SCP2 domain-containing protein n=1 Tax=Flavobacterium suaedae TaxID=1767027 RepID=A0ABQ1K3H5_9FLAO|nr:hypothetical protein [Flavobacterium suaedae]GGB83048.1 hypothetical protein GCM10007424_23840 [Flavobacterium suaedae]
MDKLSQLKKQLQQIVGANPNLPIRGVVTAVNGQSCSVKLAGGLVITGVRLKATIGNGADYMLITPAINTNVLLLSGNGTLDDLSVIKADSVQKAEFSISGLIVLLDGDDGKVQIQNNEASLKDIFSDLTELLRAFKVYTPMGPSGTALPDTATAIDEFETKFNNLLK